MGEEKDQASGLTPSLALPEAAIVSDRIMVGRVGLTPPVRLANGNSGGKPAHLPDVNLLKALGAFG